MTTVTLKGNPVSVAGSLPKKGEGAPDSVRVGREPGAAAPAALHDQLLPERLSGKKDDRTYQP